MPDTEWPVSGLDLDGLAAAGWCPVPFQEFILKIHGRCNLACDYCYVYEAADQSWRSRPAAMSVETVRAMAARVAGHAERHTLTTNSWKGVGRQPSSSRSRTLMVSGHSRA